MQVCRTIWVARLFRQPDWSICRDGAAGRAYSPEADLTIVIGIEMAAQIHFRLLRVLILIHPNW